MTQHDTRDPDEIERDILKTQRDMSRTVDDIGNQLTPRNLLNALLDRANADDVDAATIIDGARRNPIALGLIAAGGIWLVSDSDARPSSLKPSGMGSGSGDDDEWSDTHEHRHYTGYVEHMARVEPRADEDDLLYRRRRDHARASYLMIEPEHDEDDSSFRRRLDEATHRMRENRDKMTARASAAGRTTRRRGRQAAGKVESAYYENPLLGGLAAALVGALAGSALPATRTEEEQLGVMGEKAIVRAEREARKAGEQARDKKDELVGKAQHKMEG